MRHRSREDLVEITCTCGVQIEGVWHTSVVVGGLEYYFGCGVSQSSPGLTPFGRPVQVVELGYDPCCLSVDTIIEPHVSQMQSRRESPMYAVGLRHHDQASLVLQVHMDPKRQPR